MAISIQSSSSMRLSLLIYKRKLKRLIRKLIGKEIIDDATVGKWRNWDIYSLDIIRTPALSIHIDKALPSEPPGGITYEFGPSGYITQGKNLDYCVIYTPRRGFNNYCHWTLNEVPLMLLALDSGVKNIVFPDAFLNATNAFQVRWLEILGECFPGQNILPLSSLPEGIDGIVPVNHESSSSERPIGMCAYKHYHNGRAMPYSIKALSEFKSFFGTSHLLLPERFYIKRKHARLRNENAVLSLLLSRGFHLIDLADLTLDEQVQLFSKAEFVIGCHGAGLVNTIFCEAGTRVVEVADIDMIHPCYEDGIVIPGVKATRTFFHMLSHMKNLAYTFVESHKYVVNVHELEVLISE